MAGAGGAGTIRGIECRPASFNDNTNLGRELMSDVARNDNDGPIDGGRGRAAGLLGGAEGGGSGSSSGPIQKPELASGLAGLALRTPEDRAQELDRAVNRRVFGWFGRHETLVSPAIKDRRIVIAHLTVICKAERRRALAGHWSYDKARHDQIYELLAKEQQELEELES